MLGNWRDLQRLADNLLLTLTADRDGVPPGRLYWQADRLDKAIGETFESRQATPRNRDQWGEGVRSEALR